MISRYSATCAASALPAGHPAFDRRHAGADGGERVVDLVHDAGGQLPDRRQLLALEDLALDPVPVGHVLADRDDVGDLVAVEPHRNLAEPEEPRLAAQRDLLLGLLDLAGLEDPVELGAQLRRRLAGEHVEHRPADDVVAAEALGARLALAVPALDAVVAVDDVEAERQAVDDEAGEAPVLLDLARLRRHLAGEVGGQLDRGEIRRQEIRHDGQHLEIGRVRRGAAPPAARAARPRARAGSDASPAVAAGRRASGPARAGPAPAVPGPRGTSSSPAPEARRSPPRPARRVAGSRPRRRAWPRCRAPR